MTCDDAMGRLLEYVFGSRSREVGSEAALGTDVFEHIASCLRCLEELRVLGFLAAGETSDALGSLAAELRCKAARERMPIWLGLGLRPEDSTSEHPAEWRHVEDCPRCSGEYRDLLRVLDSARTSPWEEKEGVRRFQHSLSIPVAAAPASRGEEAASRSGPGGHVAAALDDETGLRVEVSAVQVGGGFLDLELVVNAPEDLAELGVPAVDLLRCEAGGQAAVRAFRTREPDVRGLRTRGGDRGALAAEADRAHGVEYTARFRTGAGAGAFLVRIRGAAKTWELLLDVRGTPGAGDR